MAMGKMYLVPRKRKTYKKKNTSIAKQALAVAKRAKLLSQGDLKYIYPNATVVLTSTADIANLNGVAEGTDVSERVGLKMRQKWMRFNFRAISTSTAQSLNRILIIRDKRQDSDTVPAIGEILENSTDPLSFITDNAPKRYQILYDKMFLLSGTSAGTDEVPTESLFRTSFKSDFDVEFNGSAATDYERNGVYMVMLSDQATTRSSVTYRGCITYRDV